MLLTTALLSLLVAADPPPTDELESLRKEGYARSWDVVVLLDLQGLSSGPVGWEQTGSLDFQPTVSSEIPLAGLQVDVGNYDGFIGFSLFSLRVARARGEVDFRFDDATPAMPFRVTRYGVAVFQPRARFHYWKLQAFAQVGVDFEIVSGAHAADPAVGNVKAYSLGLGGRAGVRGFVWKGMFVELEYGLRAAIAIGQVPLTHGLLAGVGYAF